MHNWSCFFSLCYCWRPIYEHILYFLHVGNKDICCCCCCCCWCVDVWSEDLDEGKSVDGEYFDHAKAFYTVPYDKLIYKLSKFGLSAYLLQWFTHFLTDRNFQV